jgi:heme-degrading monooxygenase HmoA
MITRIWRGWTTRENAAAYQSLLLNEIFPAIASRNVAGYRGISLVRRDQDTEVEFVTIMWFDSIAAVRAFAGDNHETAVVPPKARAVLSRFDERSAHYETIVAPPP